MKLITMGDPPGRRSLTDEVTRILTERIRSGELPAGSWLPTEKVMAEQFAVSRTVIREAVSRLKSEGLVSTRQGKGASVRPANAARPFRLSVDGLGSALSVLQLLELRTSLESDMAGLAAKRRSNVQLAAMKRALAAIDSAMAAGGNGGAEDMAFHLSIARGTGNPFYEDLISFIQPYLFNAIILTRSEPGRREAFANQTREEHRAILEAIARKDSEAAVEAARQHMANVAVRIRKMKLDQRSPEELKAR